MKGEEEGKGNERGKKRTGMELAKALQCLNPALN